MVVTAEQKQEKRNKHTITKEWISQKLQIHTRWWLYSLS